MLYTLQLNVNGFVPTACYNLILCHQAMYKDVIAITCIVDGSHLFTFSYMMSCTYVCQLVWLTYCFKVIDSLMQDIWVSSYKQTGPDHLFLEP
jgi:hypothetical protein